MFFYKNFWRSKRDIHMTNMKVKTSISLRRIGCMIFIIIHNEYRVRKAYDISFKLTETLLREIFYRIYLLKLWQDRQYDLL